MSTNDFLARALASLQETVAVELHDDLRSSRQREFAACAGRVLARLQTGVAAAPALATQRLERWRQLTGGTPGATPSAPLDELLAHAAQAGRALQAAEAPTDGWFREAVSATRDYLDAYERALPKPGATATAGP